MIIRLIQPNGAVLRNGNRVFYLHAAPAKLIIRRFDVEHHIFFQNGLIVRRDRGIVINLKTKAVSYMVAAIVGNTGLSGRFHRDSEQLTCTNTRPRRLDCRVRPGPGRWSFSEGAPMQTVLARSEV